MATGHADRLAGDEQPRTGEKPVFDGLLHPPIGTAGVAYGGEPTVQHRPREDRGARGHERQRDRLERTKGDLAQEDMCVTVDEAGHEGATTTVQDLG